MMYLFGPPKWFSHTNFFCLQHHQDSSEIPLISLFQKKKKIQKGVENARIAEGAEDPEEFSRISITKYRDA